MLLEHIRFKNRQALKVEINSKDQINLALQKLGLAQNKPVIVMIGGAGSVRAEDWAPIRTAIKTIARVAETTQAAFVDGGTESGVMAVIGQIRTEKGYTFPLIGTPAEGTTSWPKRKMGLKERLTFNRDAGILDSNHTHFILVPGKNWGDESPWIADIATQIAGDQPSVAVLINGGNISRNLDVPNNMKVGRTVLVIEGTGRAADEFATHPPDTDLMRFIHVNELDRLAEELEHHLQPAV